MFPCVHDHHHHCLFTSALNYATNMLASILMLGRVLSTFVLVQPHFILFPHHT